MLAQSAIYLKSIESYSTSPPAFVHVTHTVSVQPSGSVSSPEIIKVPASIEVLIGVPVHPYPWMVHAVTGQFVLSEFWNNISSAFPIGYVPVPALLKRIELISGATYLVRVPVQSYAIIPSMDKRNNKSFIINNRI